MLCKIWYVVARLLTFSQTFNLQDQEKITSSGPNPFNSDTEFFSQWLESGTSEIDHVLVIL